MRIGIPVVLAAALAATPAMAQLVIRTDDADSARHQYEANQSRADAHQEMNEARDKAAVGDYRGAAHEQAEARRDWHHARREQRDANRDNGGVRVEIGH